MVWLTAHFQPPPAAATNIPSDLATTTTSTSTLQYSRSPANQHYPRRLSSHRILPDPASLDALDAPPCKRYFSVQRIAAVIARPATPTHLLSNASQRLLHASQISNAQVAPSRSLSRSFCSPDVSRIAWASRALGRMDLQAASQDLVPTTETARPETPPTPVIPTKSESPEHRKFASPTPRTTSSMTPPPSSQLPDSRTVARTPASPTPPQLTSPPPTSKLPSQPPALLESAAALYSQDQINNASTDELRSMVNSLSNAFRDMRLSAAHYKLQYNMAVMESQESASRMAVELAMAQRELDVLQQAEEKRRAMVAPEQSYHESANAANAIVMSEMSRQLQVLQNENEEIRDLYDQQKRLVEHREGELASLIEENDRLKTRIRKNRDHIAPLLEQIEQSSPRSVFGTPHQPTPRNRVSRVPPALSNENSRGQNNFEALLLADKMLSQETATAPSTPTRLHAPRSRFGHSRGAQSMSSLPQTPNRRTAQPRAEVPRTPPHFIPTTIPQSAPPAHYQHQHQPKPSHDRRQSSNSTITASSVDEEEAFTDREGEDEIPESQASQMATNLLRRAPSSSKGQMSAPSSQQNLVQSKIFGQVKKGHGLTRPNEFEKRRLQSSEHHGSPKKRGRIDHGVGLGIGGLLRE